MKNIKSQIGLFILNVGYRIFLLATKIANPLLPKGSEVNIKYEKEYKEAA